MCESLHVAVKMCINYSFFYIYIYIIIIVLKTFAMREAWIKPQRRSTIALF